MAGYYQARCFASKDHGKMGGGEIPAGRTDQRGEDVPLKERLDLILIGDSEAGGVYMSRQYDAPAMTWTRRQRVRTGAESRFGK
jgi:hypothetical protein